MISDLRVGIPIIGSQSWLGGVSHMELHIKAVTSIPKTERPQLFLIITEESFARLALYQPFITLFDGAVYIGAQKKELDVPVPVVYCAAEAELFQHIDFYFPVNFNVLPGRCAASWVHDFQHKYLPQLFSKRDIEIRDALCARIADYSRLIFCSSFSVEQDFHTFYPCSQAITRVLSLRVYPEDEWYKGNPVEVQEKYGLPDSFVLCSNQFWLHKNHKLLFNALHLLRQKGVEVHLVCTGQTGDFRNPRYFSELQDYLTHLGIDDLVHILGLIPRGDQIQLLRRCLFVVQPSLFEGLGLIVQECQALGKQIIASDLEVHKEHQYGVYFERHSFEDLADKMSALLAEASPGPELKEEAKAREKAVSFAKVYAKQFCELVEDAQVIFNTETFAEGGMRSRQGLAIATSIRLSGNIKEQQKVIKSWLELGFAVYSVNSASEIPRLHALFPQVKFREASHGKEGKGHITDVLTCLYQTKAAICGIASPYTYLFGNIEEAFLFGELDKSIVYVRVTKLESTAAKIRDKEYIGGAIFLGREQIGMCPVCELYLEEPWWCLWLLLVFLSKKYTLKAADFLSAYELAGNEKIGKADLIEQGRLVAAYIPPPFPLDEDLLSRYHQLLWKVAEKNTCSNKNSSQV